METRSGIAWSPPANTNGCSFDYVVTEDGSELTRTADTSYDYIFPTCRNLTLTVTPVVPSTGEVLTSSSASINVFNSSANGKYTFLGMYLWGYICGDVLVGMYWWGCTGGDVLVGMYWWGFGGDVLVGMYWWGCIGGDVLVGMYWWGCIGGDVLQCCVRMTVIRMYTKNHLVVYVCAQMFWG